MQRSMLCLWLISLLAFTGLTEAQTPAQTDSDCGAASATWIMSESEHTLEYNGLTRRYLLYIPPSYDASQRVPLILSLHGFASNPNQQTLYSEWNTLADEHNFIVVYPQGTGRPLRWNSGLRLFGDQNGVDDVGFIRALIDTLSESLCVDNQRIYVNGLSNGGGMSHRIACELADQVAAIGGVAGAYDRQPCQPSRPIPVIAFHGTADRIVPYAGNASTLPPVEEWAADWAERDGCAPEPETLTPVGDASAIRYGDCEGDAEVILYTLAGAGHTWPGGGEISSFITGLTNQDIEASALMYDFFMSHPLPSIGE